MRKNKKLIEVFKNSILEFKNLLEHSNSDRQFLKEENLKTNGTINLLKN